MANPGFMVYFRSCLFTLVLAVIAPLLFVDSSFIKTLDENGFIDRLYQKN